MTEYTINGPTVRVDALNIETGDTVLVNQGGEINASSPFGPYASGIHSTGTGNTITVNGTVGTVDSYGITVGVGSSISIGTTGYVYGPRDGIWLGKAVTDADIVVHNAGNISATGSAALAARAGISIVGSATINNSGTITGGTDGILSLQSDSNNHLTVSNDGTIKGSNSAIHGTLGDDTIINAGHLEGVNAVYLDKGHDVYDARNGGTSVGNIDLGEGDDNAKGGAGAETFLGGEGSDWIDGGGGADIIDGGEGWDLVSYLSTPATQGGITVDLSDNTRNGGAAAGDVLSNVEVVQGTNQNDIIKSINRGNGIGAELHGEGGHDSLIGKGGGDRLFGDAGNDTLDGGAGGDRLEGGAGNDTYVIDNAGDTVIEAADGGIDTAIVSFDFRLDRLANVEILKLADGSVATHATGTAGNDRLIGNSNFNILDGGAGADTMEGGAGSDVFVIDNAGDTVIEAAGGGTDAVQTSVSYALADSAEVEFLTALGSDAIALTGNVFANTLSGNAGANVLAGAGGDDTLSGLAGADQLFAGLGNDRAFGGEGNDVVKGEAGNDTIGGGAGTDKLYGMKGAASRDAFVFDTRLTSKSVANRNKDTIVDFGPKYDSIYLDDAAFTNKTIAQYLKGKGASLDHAVKMKSSFFRVGDKALDRNDFFIAKKVTSKEYKLYWDADGSGSKAMLEIGTVKLQKGEGTSLTYKDFFFI